MKIVYPKGATPIDPDELSQLIPEISIQRELNEFENVNIREAMRWAERRNRFRRELLTEPGIRELHRRMFDKTWGWAGSYRTTGKNIGVESWSISSEVKKLCDDIRFQIDRPGSELFRVAVSFHHRLTLIHPFPNGNGRHARLAADLLMRYAGEAEFTWGGYSLVDESLLREEYLEALRKADRGDLEPLVEFAGRG